MSMKRRLRSTAILTLAVLFLVACQGTAEPPTPTATPTAIPTVPAEYAYSELISLFDYASQAPLDVQEKSARQADGIDIHDISYASPTGSRVTAYLVVPAGEGPFAGIIFMHWGPGNREEFLPEASQMAKLGSVCLLPDAPFRRIGHSELTPDAMYIQTIKELQRAVDLLTSRADVDPSRLGYVGHSFGATAGGILAGVDKRIKAYVLMAGHPRMSESGLTIVATDPRLDAIHYIGHASPSALFFQFAERDENIARDIALDFYEAGSEPKMIQWYDATHELNDQARLDRIAWLSTQLDLENTR